MAGFEVIVRPVIFPNIRPVPTRSLAPENDPEKGVAIINGSGGGMIEVSRSENSSWSRNHPVETMRKFDKVRIKKMDEDGNVDEDTYIDIEYMKKVWTRGGDGTETTYRYADMKEAENVEILEEDQTRANSATG